MLSIWSLNNLINSTRKIKDENIISHPDLEKRFSRNQIVLDFSNDDVVDNVLNQITESLKDIRVDYIKYDMNRFLGDIYSLNTRQGEIYHKYVLGVYKFMDKLLKAFPNMLFENCSSGGGRFDLGMFYFSPQIWTSDNTDAVERAEIQYGTSLIYPMSCQSAHVSVCPNHQTGRTVSMQARHIFALTGSFGYELAPEKIEEKIVKTEKEFLRL